jgi:sugar lactone lactonase YvrE
MSTAIKIPTRNRLMSGALLTATMVLTGCIAGLDYDRTTTTAIQNVYVASGRNTNSSITKFPLPTTLAVNVAPTADIAGSNTTLDEAHRTAFDASGNIYVTSFYTNEVAIFAAAATGNIAPTTTISGGNTALDYPSGIALDSTGKIYIANQYSGSGVITVYAAGATGNATPVAIITGSNTGLNEPNGLALDSTGKLYVADENSCGPASVTVYAAGATGNATPVATISGSNTLLTYSHAVALDSAGRIYVVNGSCGSNPNSVTVYAAGATGNVAPIAVITGSNTTLSDPNGISLDAAGNIYVGNRNTIDVFAANPVGTLNEAPIASITGSNTGLTTPIHGVSVH